MKADLYPYLLVSSILIHACSSLDLIAPKDIVVDVSASAVCVAIIGDYGTGSQSAREVATLVHSFNPDMVLTCGDNNYPNGEQGTLFQNIGDFYCDYIYNYDAPINQRCTGPAATEKQNRFFPSIGNHDYKSGDGAIPYLNYFTLPGNELYYEFNWGPIHFFALDSNKEIEAQRTWFEQRLAFSDKPFVIVYFHHPPYSSGLHGNDANMQWDFSEVDLVIAGHDHIYSRIVKIGEGKPVYIVNGLGGREKRICNVSPLLSGFTDFCYDENYGAVKINADTSFLQLQFINIEGDIIDEVTLIE